MSSTWISPAGKIANQIDHMLVESKHMKYVVDGRLSKGANMDIYYVSVGTIIKYRGRHKEEESTKIRF